MTKEEITAWLITYAWMGDKDEQAREVECIMAQNEWEHLMARADKFASAQWEPGPEAMEEGIGYALSALYECHDKPHLVTCPRDH